MKLLELYCPKTNPFL